MTQENKAIHWIRVFDLLDNVPVASILQDGGDIGIRVLYADLGDQSQRALPEAVGIQRLLTLASNCVSLSIEWDEALAKLVFGSPALFPLLAVLLCLQDVQHSIRLPTSAVVDGLSAVEKARKALVTHRLQIDVFADCQVAICADSLGHGAHPDLYGKNGGLFTSDEVGGLMEDLITNHLAGGVDQSLLYRHSEVLGVIVSELFENTEIHAKKDLGGRPIKRNGIRGLILKRIEQESRSKSPSGKVSRAVLPYLELSVFDSGVGFYSSFCQSTLDASVTLDSEWEVMHYCLGRHASAARPDRRPGYRGLGLYEVLRALKLAGGYLEVRTGRLRAYRSFFEGDLPVQIEPNTSETRPGMPKPVLLDFDRRHFQIPSEQESVVGSTVRVLIPLK